MKRWILRLAIAFFVIFAVLVAIDELDPALADRLKDFLHKMLDKI